MSTMKMQWLIPWSTAARSREVKKSSVCHMAVRALAVGGLLLCMSMMGRPALADAVTGLHSQGFAIHDLQGGARDLSELRGRPVLINYWASWCGPCVKEMPELDHFWQARQRHGVQVLGIANDEQAAVSAFLQRVPVSFPIWVEPLPDSASSSASLFEQTGGALPFSVLLDAQGRVVRSKLGAVTSAELAEWTKALADAPATASGNQAALRE